MEIYQNNGGEQTKINEDQEFSPTPINKILSAKESEVLSLIIDDRNSNKQISLEQNHYDETSSFSKSNVESEMKKTLCNTNKEISTDDTYINKRIVCDKDNEPPANESNCSISKIIVKDKCKELSTSNLKQYCTISADDDQVNTVTNGNQFSETKDIINETDETEDITINMIVEENLVEHGTVEPARTDVRTEHGIEDSVKVSDNNDLITEELSTTDDNVVQAIEQPLRDSTGKEIVVSSDGTATIEFSVADTSWITLLDKFEYVLNEDCIRGYIEGKKRFHCLWERFLTSTISAYSVRSSDRYYKNVDEDEEGAVCGRILKGAPRWSRLPLVPFDGVPFVFMERKYFGCRFSGPDRKNSTKGMNKTSRQGQSMKCGCPAEGEVVEVWRVPELAIPDYLPSDREKRRQKQKLLAKVRAYILLGKFTVRYYMTLPLITKHQNHPVLDPQAGNLKCVHPSIINRIYELVEQGIYEKRIIKYMLESFVKEYEDEFNVEILPLDRSFYPKDRDIVNHVRNARMSLKKNTLSNVIDVATHEDNIGEVTHESSMEIGTNDHLDYTTELVEASNYPEIIATSGEISYIATHSSTVIGQRELTVTDAFSQPSEANDSSSLMNSSAIVDTVSIDGIVSRDVMDYCQTVNQEMGDNVDSTIKLLLDPCKKKVQKTDRKWLVKSKSLRKQKDLAVLLREEIQKSLAEINVTLQAEKDEQKLHTILKKVKVLQRTLKGPDKIDSKRLQRKRNYGIRTMVTSDT